MPKFQYEESYESLGYKSIDFGDDQNQDLLTNENDYEKRQKGSQRGRHSDEQTRRRLGLWFGLALRGSGAPLISHPVVYAFPQLSSPPPVLEIILPSLKKLKHSKFLTTFCTD